MFRCFFLQVMVSFLVLIVVTLSSDAIEVGVGKTEITPNKPMRLYGYKSRTAPFVGIYDPLYCRSMVINDGIKKAVIVSFDSGTPPLGDWPQKIRQHLKSEFDIDHCLLTATHSHAAPYLGKNDAPVAWTKEIVNKMYESVELALQSMQEAQFYVGSGKVDITYDRRIINPDGSVTMLWENHERKATKPVDQRVKVVHIKNQAGNTISTLVHYACHPVISGNRNNRVSAEIPGIVSTYVREQLGGECLFLQGACGDINPYLAAYLQDDEAAYPIFVKEAQKVAKEVIKIVDHSTPIQQEKWKIDYQEKPVTFSIRHPLDDQRMQDLLNGFFSEEGLERFVNSDQTLEANVSILTLGDKVAWVGFPGEFFDDFQVELYQRTPIEHTFFVGYCNGMYSYFPTIEAAAEGGYGASWGLLAEAGTGERMLDVAIIGLYEMLGKM